MKKFHLALSVLLIISCGANAKLTSRYKTIETHLDQEKYAEALSHLKQKKHEYGESDQVLRYLDMGILEHYQGEYKNSIAHFEQAEQRIDDLYTKSVSKAALSMITNDQALDYSGEDYENIYLNVFKALNFIELGQHESAFVEVRRINEKLNELSTRYADEVAKMKREYSKKDKAIQFGEFNFTDTAIGRFLSLLLYRSEGDFDDARIDLEKLQNVWKTQSHIYTSTPPDFTKIKTELPKENAIVTIMSFIGHGPAKYAWELEVNTFKDHTVVRGKNPNYHEVLPLELDPDLSFAVSLPKIRRRDSRIKEAIVYVNNKEVTRLHKLEDMSSVAINTFKMTEQKTLIKSLIRSSLKAVAASEASSKIRKETGDSVWGDVLSFAAKVGIQSTESADLRSWQLMPGNCYFDEIELPFGTHNLRIDYIGFNGTVIKSKQKTLTLSPSKKLNMVNTYAF